MLNRGVYNGKIAVKVPAKSNITKLERSCEAATHKLSEIPRVMDHNQTECLTCGLTHCVVEPVYLL